MIFKRLSCARQFKLLRLLLQYAILNFKFKLKTFKFRLVKVIASGSRLSCGISIMVHILDLHCQWQIHVLTPLVMALVPLILYPGLQSLRRRTPLVGLFVSASDTLY